MGKFTFFDFCAGIGAGHAGLTKIGGQCVGFSEINRKSEHTYRKIHGASKDFLKNWGDLTKININEMPDFDLMVGGFPCQDFSIIGKRRGMQDERGQIIFHLAKILRQKETALFLLENVKGLVHHDKGQSINKVIECLENAGYKVSWQVLKSSNYGVPQIRERVYFVGARKDLVDRDFKFFFPRPIKTTQPISTFLIDESPSLVFSKNTKGWATFMNYLNNKHNAGLFQLSRLLKEEYLIFDTRQSDLRLYRGVCPTLRTGRHGIFYSRNGCLRRLSGKESLLLQGFDLKQAERAQSVSQNDLLSQSGNAFTVNVIEEIAKAMIRQILFNKRYSHNRLDVTKPIQLKLDSTTELIYDY